MLSFHSQRQFTLETVLNTFCKEKKMSISLHFRNPINTFFFTKLQKILDVDVTGATITCFVIHKICMWLPTFYFPLYTKIVNFIPLLLHWDCSEASYKDRTFIIAERGASVAFMASRTNNIYSNIGKIVYDNVITNIGGAYSGTTGTFTCPMDGVYVFTWTLTTQYTKYCKANLYVNGNQQSGIQAYASLQTVSDWASTPSTMTGTFSLSSGDRVWVQTNSCTHFQGSPYNALSGWKM